MATISERLAFLVTLDADDAVRGFQKLGAEAEKQGKKAEASLDKTAAKMTKVGAGAVAAAGIAGAALFGMAKASEQAEEQQRKLQNTLDNAPQLAGVGAKAFNDLAAAIQRKTAADGDDVVGMEAQLGQLGRNKDQILELTPLIVDLARKSGTDLASAAMAVNKALDGQTKGLKGLGVAVTDTAMQVDSYSAVTDALRQSVGGYAEQEGKTFAGQLERTKNAVGDVVEAIGRGATPAISGLTGSVESVANSFTSLPPVVQTTVGSFAAAATVTAAVGGGLVFLAGKAIAARETLIKLGTAIKGLVATEAAAETVGFGSALGALAGAAAVVAAPIVAVGGAVKGIGDNIKQTKGQVDGYVAALKSQSNGLEEAVAAHAKLRFETDTLRSALEKSGVTIQQVADYIAGKQVPAVEALVQSESAARLIVNDENRARLTAIGLIRDEVGNRKAAQQAIEDEVGSHRTLTAAQVDQEQITRSVNAAVDDEVVLARDMASAVKEQQSATQRLTSAISDQRQAVEDQNRAVLESLDTELALRGAERDTADAIADMAKVNKDSKASEEDKAVAIDNAKRALLDQIAAVERNAEVQATASGKSLSAADSYRAQRDAALDLANQLGSGPLFDYLTELVAKLDAVIARSVITFEVRGTDAISRAVGALATSTSGQPVIRRASGGPVKRGDVAVVGENGPEVVTFGASGYVHPNGGTVSTSSVGTDRTDPRLYELLAQIATNTSQRLVLPETATSEALRRRSEELA